MSVAVLTLDALAPSPKAQAALLDRHYDEFRQLARKVLNGDAALVRMQPTELAHEAAIRVMGLNRIDVRDRAHFLALSATVMRQTLIDEVRRARAAKRQAPGLLTMWPEGQVAGAPVDVEALDEALRDLAPCVMHEEDRLALVRHAAFVAERLAVPFDNETDRAALADCYRTALSVIDPPNVDR